MARAGAALAAFRAACAQLARWRDASRLTRPGDWDAPCRAAATTEPAAFAQFLKIHFRTHAIGTGDGFATGYFVPEYAASEQRAAGLVPVLGPPRDLDCGQAPCPTRAEIMAGALAGRAEPLLWMDPVDLFFLQVQGSGLARLADGRLVKLGFAGHNGHSYVAIGRLLRDRGALPPGAGMADIRAWIAANRPARDALLNANPRYIFFRRMAEDAPFPVGALGSQLFAEASVAVDPGHVPLGAFVQLETRLASGELFRRFMVAADTGSAIVGANRYDIYFGSGAEAALRAGDQQAPARAIIHLPRPAS